MKKSPAIYLMADSQCCNSS